MPSRILLSSAAVRTFWTLWASVLAVVTVVVVRLWLKSAGHPALGAVLHLVLALPGLLYAFFLAVVILSGARWNYIGRHG
jgi:hypothetical protein